MIVKYMMGDESGGVRLNTLVLYTLPSRSLCGLRMSGVQCRGELPLGRPKVVLAEGGRNSLLSSSNISRVPGHSLTYFL